MIAFVATVAAVAAINSVFLFAAANVLRRAAVPTCLFTARSAVALGIWTLYEAELASRSIHTPQLISLCVLMGAIGVSVVTDLAAGYILDIITIPSFLVACAMSMSAGNEIDVLTGAVYGSLPILFMYVVSRGGGMGLGDAKLAACVGALIGPGQVLVSIGLAFIFGACVAMVLLITHRADRKSSAPFAPYLMAGTVAVLSFARA